jgi:hypothetical protein
MNRQKDRWTDREMDKCADRFQIDISTEVHINNTDKKRTYCHAD